LDWLPTGMIRNKSRKTPAEVKCPILPACGFQFIARCAMGKVWGKKRGRFVFACWQYGCRPRSSDAAPATPAGRCCSVACVGDSRLRLVGASQTYYNFSKTRWQLWSNLERATCALSNEGNGLIVSCHHETTRRHLVTMKFELLPRRCLSNSLFLSLPSLLHCEFEMFHFSTLWKS